MRKRVKEGFDRLPSESASAQIRNRARDHHRKPWMPFKIKRNRKQSRLGIEGVKNCLHQEHIRPARDEVFNLLSVGSGDLLKSDFSLSRIVHIP